MKLRDYQQKIVIDINDAWSDGHRNVLAVQATRTGKTVVFCELLKQEPGVSIAIAHRQELVIQMSVSLARNGVLHRIIAPDNLIKQIVKMQVESTGASFYNPSARCAVAGVDTLLARQGKLAPWLSTVRLWVIDEGHHVLSDNKWGRVVALMPRARGLGVTATPTRADGNGLGRHADGVFDAMVLGLQMREAIDLGWLLDYRVFAPLSDLDLSDVPVSDSTGEYSPTKLRNAVKRSHLVGDVVDHYRRYGPGDKVVVFASDVDSAVDIAARFNSRGVPAEIVSAKTPPIQRALTMQRFERGELLALVNVDLFGEGTDLPDLDMVIMARPTKSLSLFAQQWNRPGTISLDNPPPSDVTERLRAIAASAKTHAKVVDAVGNVTEFRGPPDAVHNQQWTLDRQERRSRLATMEGVIPVRGCPECAAVYERFHPACPFCGYAPKPTNRSSPEHVDGDLTELDSDVLAEMRGAVAETDMPADEYRAELQRKHCPAVGVGANLKRHAEKQQYQDLLRAAMTEWTRQHIEEGLTDRQCHRLFYLRFGIDVLSAQSLNAKEAFNLVRVIVCAPQ